MAPNFGAFHRRLMTVPLTFQRVFRGGVLEEGILTIPEQPDRKGRFGVWALQRVKKIHNALRPRLPSRHAAIGWRWPNFAAAGLGPRSMHSWHWMQYRAHGTASRRRGLIASSQLSQMP